MSKTTKNGTIMNRNLLAKTDEQTTFDPEVTRLLGAKVYKKVRI